MRLHFHISHSSLIVQLHLLMFVIGENLSGCCCRRSCRRGCPTWCWSVRSQRTTLSLGRHTLTQQPRGPVWSRTQMNTGLCSRTRTQHTVPLQSRGGRTRSPPASASSRTQSCLLRSDSLTKQETIDIYDLFFFFNCFECCLVIRYFVL